MFSNELFRNRIYANNNDEYSNIKYSDNNGLTWNNMSTIKQRYEFPMLDKDYIGSVNINIDEVNSTKYSFGEKLYVKKIDDNQISDDLSIYKFEPSKSLDNFKILKDSYSGYRYEDIIYDVNQDLDIYMLEHGDSGRNLLRLYNLPIDLSSRQNSVKRLFRILHSKSNSNDFTGLKIGDYVDLYSFKSIYSSTEDIITQSNDDEKLRLIIVGFNYFGEGSGILFQFKHPFQFTDGINISTSTALTYLYNLNDVLDSITNQLENKLGVILQTSNSMCYNAYTMNSQYILQPKPTNKAFVLSSSEMTGSIKFENDLQNTIYTEPQITSYKKYKNIYTNKTLQNGNKVIDLITGEIEKNETNNYIFSISDMRIYKRQISYFNSDAIKYTGILPVFII